MEKKVYTKDLAAEEVIKRIRAGEKVYEDGSNCYSAYHDGFIMFFSERGELISINNAILLGDELHYFIDEVEEEEADESCVGKLCWFWDDDEEYNEELNCIGILGCVEKEEKVMFWTRDDQQWDHCRPLTREDAEKLIKE